jgi:hypothetical protein
MTNLEYALILTEEIRDIMMLLEPTVLEAVDLEIPEEDSRFNVKLGVVMAFDTMRATLSALKDTAAMNVLKFSSKTTTDT